ncbi:MAG: PTS sugar transporter subunit IIC [Calditrichaeota bacterium]|nr:PTS sugar transporter subunit IIC [Calditrichota bacterium]
MSYLTTSLLIGFLSLDTTIAFQVLLSQPLFACPLIGWALGNPQLGFEIGVILQLLWISIIPVGAISFPEGNIASMIVAAIVIYFDHLGYPNIIFTLAILMGILASYVGDRLTVLDRKFNGYLLEVALSAAEAANLRKIVLVDFLSIAFYFFLMFGFTFVMLNVADFCIQALMPVFNDMLDQKLQFVKPAVFGIGFAFTGKLFYQILVKKSTHR